MIVNRKKRKYVAVIQIFHVNTEAVSQFTVDVALHLDTRSLTT